MSSLIYYPIKAEIRLYDTGLNKYGPKEEILGILKEEQIQIHPANPTMLFLCCEAKSTEELASIFLEEISSKDKNHEYEKINISFGFDYIPPIQTIFSKGGDLTKTHRKNKLTFSPFIISNIKELSENDKTSFESCLEGVLILAMKELQNAKDNS